MDKKQAKRLVDRIDNEIDRVFKTESTKDVLMRLRRHAMSERRRFNGIYKTSLGASKERAFGEMNVCNVFIRLIDLEIKTLEVK